MNGLRWWRLAHLGHNPLVRRGDRWESAFFGFVVVLILAAVPFAWEFGTVTYAQQRAAAVAAADRFRTTATLLADAPAQGFSPQGIPADRSAQVRAVWRGQDGGERTGIVSADRGTGAGAVVAVWLDKDGSPVAPPPRPGDVLVTAISAGALSWLVFVSFAAGAFLIVQHYGDRRRARRWDDEWAAFGRGHAHS